MLDVFTYLINWPWTFKYKGKLPCVSYLYVHELTLHTIANQFLSIPPICKSILIYILSFCDL